jgi:hypothetical protein
MPNMVRSLLSYYSSVVCSRASVIKLKINGVCVNKCVFCPFHSDHRRLEPEDLCYFFDMINKPNYHWIVINGGEPTIHPRFLEICDFLKERFKGKTSLALGTNLIPLMRPFGRYPKIYRTILDTYERIEVGCDDEHKNIDILEQLVPEIIQSGLWLDVNVMSQYCSDLTKHRILTLQDKFNFNISFSGLHHYYKDRLAMNDVSIPCRRRTQYFMLNCNGDGFFCFHQELEHPLFNLFTATRDKLNYYLNEYNPEPYHFCACCEMYRPEKLLHRLTIRDLPVRFLK